MHFFNRAAQMAQMCYLNATLLQSAGGRRRSMGHNATQLSDLQQRFTDLYTSLNDLLEYLQINREVRVCAGACMCVCVSVCARV
jgi:hypothetical protein